MYRKFSPILQKKYFLKQHQHYTSITALVQTDHLGLESGLENQILLPKQSELFKTE